MEHPGFALEFVYAIHKAQEDGGEDQEGDHLNEKTAQEYLYSSQMKNRPASADEVHTSKPSFTPFVVFAPIEIAPPVD